MNIDTGTVFLAFTFVYAVNSVVLYYNWRLHKTRFPETLDFFTATVLSAVSFTLFVFTPHLHRFFGNTLSHTLSFLAVVILYRGFGKFLRKPPGGWVNYSVIALAFGAFLLFGTLKPDLPALGITFALFTGMVAFRLILLVFGHYGEDDFPKYLVLGSAVIYLVSIVAMVPLYITFEGENFLAFDNRVALDLCFIMSAGVLAMLGIVLMISKRVLVHERQLAEGKTLLVKEMHHRTKNNLGVVNALLLMQSKKIDDDMCKKALEDSFSRITSLAALYDFVSVADDHESIDLRDYLCQVVDRIISGMEKPEVNIKHSLEVPSLLIGMDHAVPLGLIVTELVTNSIKYAFSERSDGEISITFREVGETEYELRYGDNGIGLPEDFDLFTVNSMGMTIIRALVSQIDAALSLDSGKGIGVSVRFQTRVPLTAAA